MVMCQFTRMANVQGLTLQFLASNSSQRGFATNLLPARGYPVEEVYTSRMEILQVSVFFNLRSSRYDGWRYWGPD